MSPTNAIKQWLLLTKPSLFRAAAAADQPEKVLGLVLRALRNLRHPVRRLALLSGDRYIEWSWVAEQMPSGPGEALDFGCVVADVVDEDLKMTHDQSSRILGTGCPGGDGQLANVGHALQDTGVRLHGRDVLGRGVDGHRDLFLGSNVAAGPQVADAAGGGLEVLKRL